MRFDLDLNDIIIAEDRLADFNEILDLANYNWDEKRPVEELQNIISTAHYIYMLLIRELQEITERINEKIYEERAKDREKHAEALATLEQYIYLLGKVLDYDENIEYLKAGSPDFEETLHRLQGLMFGFWTGRAYEKSAAGKGENAKEFLDKLRKRILKAYAAAEGAGETSTVDNMAADQPVADTGINNGQAAAISAADTEAGRPDGAGKSDVV